MYTQQEKEELLKSTIVFLLLYTLEKEPVGKIYHKKIIRGIKKYLATSRSKDMEMYLEIVDTASKLLSVIVDRMVTEEGSVFNKISLPKLLEIISNNEMELFNLWNIDSETLGGYIYSHRDDLLLFPSLMYYNRLNSVVADLFTGIVVVNNK